MNQKTPFQRLLQCCLLLDCIYRDPQSQGGAKLGFHDEPNSRITLYDVENTPQELQLSRRMLEDTGVSFRWVVDTPGEPFTNIHLLDIGL